MRPTLSLLLLLLATAAPAQPRQPFPDDYRPGPCASAAAVCKTFNQSQFADFAALRGFDIGQEWVDSHWAELTGALAPACAKIATCFATPGNTFTFCNDVVAAEVFSVCDRYPEGSVEREKCGFFVRMFHAGHDRNSAGPWKTMQECAAKNAAPSAAARTLDWWIAPAKIDASYDGSFTVYAIDSETRVPVQARVFLDVKQKLYSEAAADGQPTAFYAIAWKQRLVRVPNAEGHSDVVAPQGRIEAPGYEPVTFRLPIDVPALAVTMNPAPEQLRRGKNRVTITAMDAVTGEPVEARVMGGSSILGRTNQPFELEIRKGTKRPEIWVTSLYDRYNDVVVAPAER